MFLVCRILNIQALSISTSNWRIGLNKITFHRCITNSNHNIKISQRQNYPQLHHFIVFFTCQTTTKHDDRRRWSKAANSNEVVVSTPHSSFTLTRNSSLLPSFSTSPFSHYNLFFFSQSFKSVVIDAGNVS